MLSIIDTHAHLDEIENLDISINSARESGLVAVIAVGSDHNSNIKILDISKKQPGFIYPALGLHPWGLDKMDDRQLDITLKSIEDNIQTIAAIGEIGLDYNKRVLEKASKERQKEVFAELLKLSIKYNKPVSIHSRYAWKDCFQMVSSSGIQHAVFHWFTGFSSVLHDIISAGYYISCTPAAEYHEEHRRAIKETPVEKLLLETDCPVFYGRENRYSAQPSDAIRSLKAATSLKNTSEDIIAGQTTANAINLFHLYK
jgi:TatD DNase family protein